MAIDHSKTDPHRGDWDDSKWQDASAERDYLAAVQYHGADSLEAKIAGGIADASQYPKGS